MTHTKTDKLWSEKLTWAKTGNARQHVWVKRVLGDDRYQQHVKEISLLKGNECRVLVKIWSQSQVIVTSPYG